MTSAVLGKLWAGQIYGTNTGKIYAEINEANGSITGTIRIMDDVFGLSIFSISGSFNATEVKFTGTPTQSPDGVMVGNVEVSANLTPEGHLRGTWQSTIGTAGTFAVFPHDHQVSDQRRASLPATPEQLYTANVQLGALRLYTSDVRELFASVRKDFTTGKPVVTFHKNGSEISKYYDDFERDIPSLGKLGYMKFVIQEPEALNLNRVVIIELNARGGNDVKVQGSNESWVVGKTEAIARLLRQHESFVATNFRKWGLTINQLMFLGMLVVIPDISSIYKRIAFVASLVFMLTVFYSAHIRFIPNTVISFAPKEPTAFERMWPSILSTALSLAASVGAALIVYWLTGKAGAP